MKTDSGLEELVRTDSTLAPLARLQLVALREASDPSWQEALPALEWDEGHLAEGVPLLHERRLALDPARVRVLLIDLADTAGEHRERLRSALLAPGFDPLEALLAAIAFHPERLASLAAEAQVDASALAVLVHLASVPLLRACARSPATNDVPAWRKGYCPVCAAWPTLVEQRGIERLLYARCGRCASNWGLAHQVCVFCGSREQSYFSADRQRESRRAVVCESCHGYLKVLATLTPLDADDILLQDMLTVELDLAAIEHGYARPETPGFAPDVRLEAAGQSRNGR